MTPLPLPLGLALCSLCYAWDCPIKDLTQVLPVDPLTPPWAWPQIYLTMRKQVPCARLPGNKSENQNPGYCWLWPGASSEVGL